MELSYSNKARVGVYHERKSLFGVFLNTQKDVLIIDVLMY